MARVTAPCDHGFMQCPACQAALEPPMLLWEERTARRTEAAGPVVTRLQPQTIYEVPFREWWLCSACRSLSSRARLDPRRWATLNQWEDLRIQATGAYLKRLAAAVEEGGPIPPGLEAARLVPEVARASGDPSPRRFDERKIEALVDLFCRPDPRPEDFAPLLGTPGRPFYDRWSSFRASVCFRVLPGLATARIHCSRGSERWNDLEMGLEPEVRLEPSRLDHLGPVEGVDRGSRFVRLRRAVTLQGMAWLPLLTLTGFPAVREIRLRV